MLYVSEYEAPHKLTAPHLRGGLHPMNIFADVVNRKTIPTAADLIARFEYHAERLTAAAITQTYNYMIEGGLEYGLLTTGEAITFLRVDWQDPETLLYHLAEPSFEMADRSADKRHACTAVGQYLAFRLMALGPAEEQSRPRPPDERNRVIAPPPSLASSYAPTTHGRVSRSLVARRKARDRPERQARRRKSDESSSDEAGRAVPGSPSPSERRTKAVQQSQRSERILAWGRQGQNGQESQQYCTHQCLLGLSGRGHLDERCSNITLHRQGESRLDNPVRRGEFLELLRAQLQKSMDEGITKLHMSGVRGALTKSRSWLMDIRLWPKEHCQLSSQTFSMKRWFTSGLNDSKELWCPCVLGPSICGRCIGCTTTIIGSTLNTFCFSRGVARGATLPRPTKQCIRAVHQAGVVHGDVRPENVLGNEETGKPMLVDFERSV
ncbi:uncharacterized protein JN550_012834 [Neoarthrinium moseri]|uniref:uncharacterized protein n=1 Tax=Neoarthrinium moseri TaxID=1658444 RepID=UPI001FDC59F9|nr:uncharacterized protein JN550_012834 [Neoarthrinium moseri]KAI1858303.1 hypothetical protein JN550_012834 [Neoarthrinium moseri]